MKNGVGQPKMLDNEIIRLGNAHWNKTQPPTEAIITKVNTDNTVDIRIGENLDLYEVPLMQPITTGNGMNITVNSRVIVIYLDGLASCPLVIGKL